MRTMTIRRRFLHAAMAVTAAVGLGGCEAEVTAFLEGRSLAEILFELMRDDELGETTDDGDTGQDDGGDNGDGGNDSGGGPSDGPSDGADDGSSQYGGSGEQRDDDAEQSPDGKGWLALPSTSWRIETVLAYEKAGDVVIELLLERGGAPSAARFRIPASDWPAALGPADLSWNHEDGLDTTPGVLPMTLAHPLGVNSDGLLLAGRPLRLIPLQSHLKAEPRDGWRFLTGAVDMHVLPMRGVSTGAFARLHLDIPAGR